MRQTHASIQAALDTRRWVRDRTKALGRPVTHEELLFFVQGRFTKLAPRELDYVVECAIPLPIKFNPSHPL